MPPKAGTTNADDSKGADIVILCHMIMGCEDFKLDNNKLAPVLGIAQGKNVPRKINTIVAPYGFELKGGKLIKKGDGDSSVPATPKSKAVDDEDDDNVDAAPTPKKRATPKKKDAPTPKTPGSQKRKRTIISDAGATVNAGLQNEEDANYDDHFADVIEAEN